MIPGQGQTLPRTIQDEHETGSPSTPLGNFLPVPPSDPVAPPSNPVSFPRGGGGGQPALATPPLPGPRSARSTRGPTPPRPAAAPEECFSLPDPPSPPKKKPTLTPNRAPHPAATTSPLGTPTAPPHTHTEAGTPAPHRLPSALTEAGDSPRSPSPPRTCPAAAGRRSRSFKPPPRRRPSAARRSVVAPGPLRSARLGWAGRAGAVAIPGSARL